LLAQGHWSQALDLAGDLLSPRRNSPRWRRLLQRFEGECHHAAGEELLGEKQYEASLERFLKAAHILELDESELREQVIAAMLAEVRRLFAAAGEGEVGATHQLIARVLLLMSPCPEAFFWQGLCYIREGRTDLAESALLQARGAADGRGTGGFIDPALYLGALLLREGRPDESLRYLSEANRIDGNCPFVTWQLGTAMFVAGGDISIATRALQRALGVRGLQQWVHSPERVWVEGFPEKRSYIRRLASRHSFLCPIFGSNVSLMVRQGQITLGQAFYKLGNFEESAKVFNQLLQESAPSLPVLRGLGLALARLDRFDQAFKHLRAAHELEEPKNFLTAGYLALCGAKGKPTQPEDKARNVHWAIRLVSNFDVKRLPEWANLLNHVFAEARSGGLPVALQDQVRLCEVLLGVDATDPLAGAAYSQLATTIAQEIDANKEKADTLRALFRPEYAWLFSRAAQHHGITAANDLELFGLTFATEGQARPFYAQRQWALDEVEYVYLARCAAVQPGAFPAALGPEYPARGEKLLLARSQWLEGLQDNNGALNAAEVLLHLAPRSPRGHDRLAYLCHRAGNLDRTAELLANWHRLDREDPLPLVRLAVVEQQRNQPFRSAKAIGKAVRLTAGKVRAQIAFLGAQLMLLDRHVAPEEGKETNRNGEHTAADTHSPADQEKQALNLLNECLQADPDHETGLWLKAALCSIWNRTEELAALAAAMGRAEETRELPDPRFYLLTAVCHLAAKDYRRVLQSADKAAAKDPTLALEAAYLKGWAAVGMADGAVAARFLQGPAGDASTSAQAHAQALLAKIAFEQGAESEAVTWWKSLDAARTKEWGLEEPLRATIFVSALQSLQQNRFAEAAERIREAGRLGLRDRRLGPLLSLTLIKAAQRLLFGGQSG
jgi:tetratricopeptide (TPR) repeat protein